MKFESMLGYWKIKEMVKHSSCQTRTRIYDSEDKHVVYSAEIKGTSMKANVLYRYTLGPDGVKSKFALIYADVLFVGFPDSSTDQIFIKNAKVTDLANELIGRL